MADDGVTQRVAAILAADAAGYTRLMAADERGTIDALDRARAVFAEHVEANQGRIVDTAGDSVLAVFEIAAGAVQAAVAIQERLALINEPEPNERRMRFRIGIHLGDIHEKADGSVYGDGVNVSARLEGLAEPGTIVVSDIIQGAVKGRLDQGFADLGEHEVKNVADPVRAYRVLAEGEAMPEAAKPGRARQLALAGAAVAVAAVVAIALWPSPEPPPEPEMASPEPVDPILAMPTGPSIAVLPFDNLSGDPEQEYFADGIAEDIITQLSHFPDYLVIARNTTFQYKGQAVDVAELGRELGVKFVLEGSVRRDETEVRISVQLIDTETGGHVWADSFDGDLTVGSLFDIQDAITEQVTAKLADTYGVISQSGYERSLARDTATLSAYECVLGAHGYYGTNFTPSEHARVRACLEQAVEAAPNYADAWAWLAAMYRDEQTLAFNTMPDALDRAEGAARKAIEIDADNQEGNLVLAYVLFLRHDISAFVVQARRTVQINPNSADALASLGGPMAYAGYWEEGLAWTLKAMKLNPKFPVWFHHVFYWDYYRRGLYEEALGQAELGHIPGYWVADNFLAMVHGKLGHVREAKAALTRLLELYPTYNLIEAANFARVWNFDDELIGELVDGLRKAGLPEGTVEAPSRPVIAVLPFDNMSGDPEQEYFADGITEDIITRLAQFPDLLVLGRNTTFQFKGEAVDIPTIAEKLGADYVVEGSIRRGGDTVRVTAQLLGGDGGTHLWAETYDRALDPADLFAMQDAITETVASRIGDPHGVIGRAEFQRSARHAPQHFSSYNCTLRFFEFRRHFNAETHNAARDCLREVVEAEPDYGEAMAFLGNVYLAEITFGFNATAESSLQRVLETTERAVAIDPRSGLARVYLAEPLYLTGKPARAVREVEEALRLDPNNVDVVATAGVVLSNTGAYARTEEIMDKVTELNPNYPAWMNWNMAKVYLTRGEFPEAIRRLEMTQMRWWYWTTAFTAAAYCANGNIDIGRENLDAALEANPSLAEVYWPEMYSWNKGPNVRPMIDTVAAGLEACGWDAPPDPGRETAAQ